MKSILRISAILAITCLLPSCRGFLDERPQGNTGTTGEFYKGTSDIEYALTAAYANLQSSSLYRDAMVLMTDVRSDDLGSFANTGGNAGREYSIKIFTAQSDNQIFRNVWQKTYETIYRCNNVISHINVVNDSALKLQYEAEARFIRALCYFNIVRFWGDAPLILEPLTAVEVAKCERNKTAELYKAIEDDLTFAADSNNLPRTFSGKNLGRVTTLSAKAVLGKVFLQQKKFSDAKDVLEQLIETDNQGYHQLMPDIADVFSTAPPAGSPASAFKSYTGWSPQKNNKEVLFAVNYDKDIANEGRPALTYYANQADLNEEFKRSNTQKCIYLEGDRRADLMLSMKGTNTDNNLMVKFADVQSSLGQYGYNTIILRWSDVLLMYAEACNELVFDSSASAPAMKYLNLVRTRSLPTGAYSDGAFSSKEECRAAIFLERRLEFPMEMQRWFDLLRAGTAIEEIAKIGITIDEHCLLYPIPFNEISLRNDNEKFPQNPGY